MFRLWLFFAISLGLVVTAHLAVDNLIELVSRGKASLERGEDQDYIIIDGAKLGIDTPESIVKKARWVKENGFGGIFNWQEGSDYNGSLRNAMWNGMFGE